MHDVTQPARKCLRPTQSPSLDNSYFPRYAEHYSTSQKEAEVGEHGLDGSGPSHWEGRQKSPRTAFGGSHQRVSKPPIRYLPAPT